MPELRRRLARLEHSAAEMLPDQQECPFCHGWELLAFSDEPNNTGPPQPCDGAGGTCRLCRMPPPGRHVLQLPAAIARHFATLPWSDEPRMRFVQKVMLLKAIATRDTQAAERAVKMLHERDANGLRHWLWPEIERSWTAR